MILIAALILCVATVPLAGGRIVKLGNIHFQRAWAGLAALALQYSIMRLFPEGEQDLHGILHLVSYGLMFYFLAANLAIPGLWLIGLGGACNALAIAANNGVMPAQPSALATAGIVQVPGEVSNSAAVFGTRNANGAITFSGATEPTSYRGDSTAGAVGKSR